MKFSWCTPWVKILSWLKVKLSLCWLCGKFSDLLFYQRTCFLVNIWRKEILIKSWNFIAVAQKLKELWLFQIFTCPKCSRVCASRIGLYSHQWACRNWPSTFPLSFSGRNQPSCHALWLVFCFFYFVFSKYSPSSFASLVWAFWTQKTSSVFLLFAGRQYNTSQ